MKGPDLIGQAVSLSLIPTVAPKGIPSGSDQRLNENIRL
jgi:hypothetical protein